jgi:hypothetical protein
MMHVGKTEIGRNQVIAALVAILAVMTWLNVSVAGLPLIPIALVLVAIALFL